jgi:hypothetical protein
LSPQLRASRREPKKTQRGSGHSRPSCNDNAPEPDHSVTKVHNAELNLEFPARTMLNWFRTPQTCATFLLFARIENRRPWE